MRPRLAPGFTVLVDASTLWLVAGEDIRYRLTVDDPTWLRDLLARCDGTRTIEQLASHADARTAIDQLIEERVLVEGTAAQAHAATGPGYRVGGHGRLAAAVGGGAAGIDVFVQDSLDYRALLARNREAIAAKQAWMWITTGPGGRAYVGPLFVPGAGPCAECLLVHFKRLSPVPELYDALLAHGGAIEPSPFPDAAIETISALAKWKLSLASEPMAAPLYTLHVIELADLTISAHAPLVDVECEACR